MFRAKVLKIDSKSGATALCNDYRSLHSSKCAGSKAIKEIHLCGCRHNMACLKSGTIVDTVILTCIFVVLMFNRCGRVCRRVKECSTCITQ